MEHPPRAKYSSTVPYGTIPQTAAYAAGWERCGNGRAQGTIEKYLRDVRSLAAWLAGETITKERTLAWKDHLLTAGYAPRTVNSMLTAVNHFLTFSGRSAG